MTERALVAPPSAVTEWLAANAVPIERAAPGGATADLEPLRAMIGDARVVNLGEATHGTREFSQLKHRLIELLVCESGFTSFAIEASLPDFFALADFVSGDGDGDIDPATVLGLIWAADYEEVLDLVRWLRRHNQDPGVERQVGLWGWDPTFVASAARWVIHELERVRPSSAPEIAAALAPLSSDLLVTSYHHLPPDAHRATASAIARAAAALPDASARTLLLLDLLRRSEQQLREARGFGEWLAQRSEMAADTILRVLELDGPDGRLVGWAHNAHVQRPPFMPGVTPLGGHLAKALGAQYVNVGFVFGEGSFRAMDLAGPPGHVRAFSVPRAPVGTIDAAMAAVDHPIFAIDLRTAPTSGPVHEWLGSPAASRVVAAWSDDEALVPYAWAGLDKQGNLNWEDPRRCFDILVFVRASTPGTSNHPSWWTGSAPAAPERHAQVGDLAFTPGPDGSLAGWSVALGTGPAAYRMDVAEGRLELARDGVPWFWWGDAVISRSFDAAAHRGTRVRFGVTGGASVFARVDDDASAPQAFAVGRSSVELDVAVDAATITIGIVVNGNGPVVLQAPSFDEVSPR